MQDFATLTEAVASFEAGAEGTVIVHQALYGEAVIVDGGRTVAFLVNADDEPVWAGAVAGMAPQLTVLDGTVLMDGIQMSGNGSSMDPGLLVDGGRAWVDRGRIVDNNGGGIVAQAGAELVLRNCFVGSGTDTTVLSAQNAVVDALYTTLAANLGDSTSATCDAASTVTVRNSLIVSRAAMPEVVCSGLTASNSAAEEMLEGADNIALGDMSTTWFEDYNSGDFHLTTAPVIIATAAQWEDGDPLTDIDGDARDAVDGTSDVAGADVP